jgi:hypothetical protein
MSENLKDQIQRLISDSLKSPFIGRKLTEEDAQYAAALYKRQIEHLGCTDVEVTVKLWGYMDGIDIEARFTPPPSPVKISFTVENKNG